MSHLSQIQNFLSDLFEKGDAHVVDPMFSQDFNKYLLGMPWCKSTNMRIDWDEIEQKKIIEVDSYGLVSIENTSDIKVFSEPIIHLVWDADEPAIALTRESLLQNWEEVLNCGLGLICMYFVSKKLPNNQYYFAEYDERRYLAGIV